MKRLLIALALMVLAAGVTVDAIVGIATGAIAGAAQIVLTPTYIPGPASTAMNKAR